jgi:hypothetical protein
VEKNEKKNEKTDKVVSPPFPPKCLQFGMDASRGPKNMGKKKSNRARVEESKTRPKATTLVKQLFFLLSGFSVESNLALQMFAAVISYVRANNVQMLSTR